MAKKDATVDFYRRGYGTADGRKILANMLMEAGFFKHVKTYEELAVENFMKTVLTKAGIFYGSDGFENAYVDKLFELPFRR